MKLGGLMKKKNTNIRLFSNKKGSILDNIGGFISGVVSVVPPQVKFLLFLLIMVFFSYILTILFNGFGVFCNSAGEPVKLNANFLSGISLMSEVPSASEVGSQDIEANVKQCREYIEAGEGNITIPVFNRTEAITTSKWYYTGSYCSDCVQAIIKREGKSDLEVCYSPATYKTKDEKTWWQNVVCNSESYVWGRCEPPEHYYFNEQTGLFSCEDGSCDRITVGQLWDEKLRSKGAELIYPESIGRDKTSNGFIGLTCTDIDPRLAIFGIDLFTFNMWLFITLIVILIWAWMHFA